MRYLKLFESVDLYLSIDEDEWEDGAERKVAFDEKYIKYIILKIKPEFQYDRRFGALGIKGDDYYDDWRIYQTEDEWFYVMKKIEDIMSGPYNDFFVYYKCDQFDGLLKYLKDNRIII